MHTVLRTLIPAFLIGCARFVSAQPLNPGFESVDISSSDTLPQNWAMMDFGAGLSENAHSGTYALQVWNWYYYGRGYAVNGTGYPALPPIQGEPYLYHGEPIAFKPLHLQGFYRYDTSFNSGHTDSAFIQITLSRYNTLSGNREALGFGEAHLPVAAVYTPFSIPVQYSSSLDPDTVTITLVSSINGFCNAITGNCLYLTVDDLSLSSLSGLVSLADGAGLLQAWPNPASDVLYINAIRQAPEPLTCELLDARGNTVAQQPLQQSTINMDVSALHNGLYFYRLKNRQQQTIQTGKVLVSH